MMFFLYGYFASTIIICNNWAGLNTLLSIVFFLSAAFIYLGVTIQGRMNIEMQKTFNVLLPICMKCQKIQADDIPGSESITRNIIKSIVGLCISALRTSMHGFPHSVVSFLLKMLLEL